MQKYTDFEMYYRPICIFCCFLKKQTKSKTKRQKKPTQKTNKQTNKQNKKGANKKQTNTSNKNNNLLNPRLPEPFFVTRQPKWVVTTPSLDFYCKATGSYDFGTGG